jgi:hypothetical protein
MKVILEGETVKTGKMTMQYRLNKNYYEGETVSTVTDDGDDDHVDSLEPNKDQNKNEGKKPEQPQQFSQDQVNKFLAEERRKLQKANERTVQQLEALRKNASLTEQEKISLEERIETIKNEFLSKEQIQQKELQKAQKKQKEEIETVQKEVGKWKNLYEETTVENSLLGAAASDPDVFNPRQILELLRPRTRLVEELDEESGKPTGRFTPRVRLPGKDKDGNNITLELVPGEAVKQLKENTTEYGNLFKSNVIKGVGGNNSGDTRKSNDPPEEPGAFRAWRKQNPDYAKSQ